MQIAVCDDVKKELDDILSGLDSYAKAHSALQYDIDRYSAAMLNSSGWASYIANLCLARKAAAKYMEMADGTRIPIPRRSSAAVQRAYMDFCRREALG